MMSIVGVAAFARMDLWINSKQRNDIVEQAAKNDGQPILPEACEAYQSYHAVNEKWLAYLDGVTQYDEENQKSGVTDKLNEIYEEAAAVFRVKDIKTKKCRRGCHWK